MSRNLIVVCDICRSAKEVESTKIPMKRVYDDCDGRTFYKDPVLTFETIDICKDCKLKIINAQPATDYRVMGHGEIKIKEKER